MTKKDILLETKDNIEKDMVNIDINVKYLERAKVKAGVTEEQLKQMQTQIDSWKTTKEQLQDKLEVVEDELKSE